MDSPHARPTDTDRAMIYAGAVWIGVLLIVVVVVAAALLMAKVGSETGPGAGSDVVDVTDDGLRIAGPAQTETETEVGPGTEAGAEAGDVAVVVVPWSSVFEITVLTRRELRRTWFGFEIRTESHGLLLLDGSRGPGAEFLAECHRFAGFDHQRLADALTRRGAREICYSQ